MHPGTPRSALSDPRVQDGCRGGAGGRGTIAQVSAHGDGCEGRDRRRQLPRRRIQQQLVWHRREQLRQPFGRRDRNGRPYGTLYRRTGRLGRRSRGHGDEQSRNDDIDDHSDAGNPQRRRAVDGGPSDGADRPAALRTEPSAAAGRGRDDATIRIAGPCLGERPLSAIGAARVEVFGAEPSVARGNGVAGAHRVARLSLQDDGAGDQHCRQ
mmetsp:Transcript_2612/g.6128  ORF Transcript_2612/g.6128 Transcript_2612/m.6128 type:complete len:211 (-) Transcript_2612:448-1080(-)